MRKIAYNSLNVTSKSIEIFAFISSIRVPNFSKIEACKRKLKRFLQSVWKQEKNELFTKICWFISHKQLAGSYSNFKCGPPWVKVNSTVNLVPFGESILELWMHENHDFVVPVNIYTHSILCVPRFLGLHDTLPCVLIHRYILHTTVIHRSIQTKSKCSNRVQKRCLFY